MSTQIIERMAVEIEGQGDALIMIHGLGGTSNTFTPQLAVIDSRFRIIRPDLPGSGRSRLIEAPTLARFAELIIGMAQTLGIERAHFAAHSLGTIVCQHIAVQQPQLVRSLLLLGPLTEPPEAARRSLQQRADTARRDGMAPMLLLDEVTAHLDADRRGALFDELLRLGTQAWMTGTDHQSFASLAGRARFWRVGEGSVTLAD
jgi:pimeloyl-ACP methyl ester carboxylesterase